MAGGPGQLPECSELAGCGVLAEAEAGESGSTGSDPYSGTPLSARPARPELGDSSRCPTVTLGPGLPPISRRLVDKIQALEYVDLAELPPARGRSRPSHQLSDDRIVVVQAADLLQTRKIIPDLATWVQCFTLYITALTGKHPHRLTDLLGYMSLTARNSKKYKWPSWIVYDQNFRQEAAGNASLTWAKADPSLYAQCFTGQEKATENWCSRCHSVDHQSYECPQAARKRPWNAGPGAQQAQQARGSPRQSAEICQKFNKYNGDCKFGNACRFWHACSKCKGPHPVTRCKSGASNQQQAAQ